MNRITYISENTRQLMQGSTEVQELASVAYRTAASLEEKLHRFSLLTSSIEQNGICVSVEESEKLDCYNTSIRLKHHSDSLTLGIASDGTIFMLLASTWDYSGDTPKLHLFHLDEMLTSSLSNELKAVARVVIYMGLMDEYLADFLDSVDDILTKEKLSAEIETVDGRTQAILADTESTEDELSVSLGFSEQGIPYAVATNYQLNKDCKPCQTAELPANVFLCFPDDLHKYLSNEAVKRIVAQYMNWNV